jgi:hypothetical protein
MGRPVRHSVGEWDEGGSLLFAAIPSSRLCVRFYSCLFASIRGCYSRLQELDYPPFEPRLNPADQINKP